MPNLIVANDVSLVKLSGHPYSHPRLSDGCWPLIASSHINPTMLILEHHWTRISYLYPAPEVFGDDLETERLSPFIEAKPTEVAAELESGVAVPSDEGVGQEPSCGPR